MPEMKEYRLTFGRTSTPHPLFPEADPFGWVAVMAPDYESAREVVMSRVGHLFCSLKFPGDMAERHYPAGEIARWSTQAILVGAVPSPADGDPDLRLYCLSHKANHIVAIADVERILYALAYMVPAAYAGLTGPNHPHPDCPLDVLRLSNEADYYAGVVDEGATLRAESGDWLATGGRLAEQHR